VPRLLSRLRRRKDMAVSEGEYKRVEDTNDRLFKEFDRLHKQEFFFDELYESQDRTAIENTATELASLLGGLDSQLREQDTEGNEDLKDRIDGYRKMLSRMRGELQELFFTKERDHFQWCEKMGGKRFANCYLHLTPISVADVLQDILWDSVPSTVCTSATLSNSGSFNYIRSRLGTPPCNELILDSPFDFRTQSLVYVPDDLEFPSEKPEYADAVAERIKELLIAAGGRAFLLFTSYRMLNAVFDRLDGDVPFRLLKQGEMSNDRLIKEFREDDETCLMGVHSFWEGVDVKGERLSCVIIDKLPFAVPDSPVHKARCDQIEQQGGNWFSDYSIPQAQIRLKQGFGRLIRTKTDRGVVAILDSRIHKKYYGKQFIKYLPTCRGTKNLSSAKEFLESGAAVEL